MPVNLAAIEARQAQQQAGKVMAQQLMSHERFQEEVEVGFNPAAVEREQARFNRFKPLNNRGVYTPPKEGKKIQEVKAKTEEDTARNFSQRDQELSQERLLALRRNLRSTSTAQEILDEVQDAFADPTLADEALNFLEQTTSGALRDTVLQARERHNSGENARLIAAGRNINPVAKQFHNKGLGETPTDLRNLYRDITGNPREHNQLFTELSAKYPFDELKKVVNFLLKAMGYDLKSKGPSIEPSELLRMLNETRNLQSILWVYLFFKSRMRLIYSQFKRWNLLMSKDMGFELLAKEFIKIVEEKYPSVAKLLKQLDNLKLRNSDLARIIILSQYRDAIRQVSPRLYKSLKHRQDLLLVIMEALEELEEIEEEEEEKRDKEEKEKKEEKKKKEAKKKGLKKL